MAKPDRASTAPDRAAEFRRAWARFATGVTIISTLEPDGRVHGMTANGVTSVSLDPPLALACIGAERNTHDLIRSTGRFGISILSAEQSAIARHFTLPPEQRPDLPNGTFAELGSSSVLNGAVAAMDCRVVGEHSAGDHTIFIAEIEAQRVAGGGPLLWLDGQFGSFRELATNSDG